MQVEKQVQVQVQVGGLDLAYFYKLGIFHEPTEETKDDPSKLGDNDISTLMEDTVIFLRANEKTIKNISNDLKQSMKISIRPGNKDFWKNVSKDPNNPVKEDDILNSIVDSFFKNFIFTPKNNFEFYCKNPEDKETIWKYNQEIISNINKYKNSKIYEYKIRQECIKNIFENLDKYYRNVLPRGANLGFIPPQLAIFNKIDIAKLNLKQTNITAIQSGGEPIVLAIVGIIMLFTFIAKISDANQRNKKKNSNVEVKYTPDQAELQKKEYALLTPEQFKLKKQINDVWWQNDEIKKKIDESRNKVKTPNETKILSDLVSKYNENRIKFNALKETLKKSYQKQTQQLTIQKPPTQQQTTQQQPTQQQPTQQQPTQQQPTQQQTPKPQPTQQQRQSPPPLTTSQMQLQSQLQQKLLQKQTSQTGGTVNYYYKYLKYKQKYLDLCKIKN
jgi:uncharacterized ubiquitin-like protein YukD